MVGRSLFDFIDGLETRHLWELMIRAAREEQRTTRLRFRCDAPACRRDLEMTLIPLEQGWVEFQSAVLETVGREPLELLRHDASRGDGYVRICSMCRSLEVAEGEWMEIQQALTKTRLLYHAAPPSLTHGLCPTCFSAALSEVRLAG